MLADGKAEDVAWPRELEAIAAASGQLAQRCFLCGRCLHGSVVGEDRLLLELEVLELIRFEDFARDCGVSVWGVFEPGDFRGFYGCCRPSNLPISRREPQSIQAIQT